VFPPAVLLPSGPDCFNLFRKRKGYFISYHAAACVQVVVPEAPAPAPQLQELTIVPVFPTATPAPVPVVPSSAAASAGGPPLMCVSDASPVRAAFAACAPAQARRSWTSGLATLQTLFIHRCRSEVLKMLTQTV